MYKYLAGLALSVAINALALGGTAQAAVVFSENFDMETQGLNYKSFAQFNVTAGSVDLVGGIPTGFYDFYPGKGNYVDLDGSTRDKNPAGQITTKMSFAPGTYLLNFDLGGSTRGDSNTVRVALGGFSQDITLGSAAGLTSQSFTFYTMMGGSLSFTNLGNSDNRGLILDNVQLSNAVPEPSTWAMMLIGFGGLAMMGSRRRRTLAI